MRVASVATKRRGRRPQPVKLRSKSFLLIFLAFIGATVLTLLGTRVVALRGFEQLEEQEALRMAGRIHRLTQAGLEDLERVAWNFARWEEVALLVNDGDVNALEDVLASDPAVESRWDLMIIAQQDSRVLIAHSSQRDDDGLVPIADELTQALLAYVYPKNNDTGETGRAEYAVVDGRVFQIAWAGVHARAAGGARVGVLLVAREMSEALCRRLGHLIDAPITLVAPSELVDRNRLEGDFVSRDEEGVVSGFAVLRAANGGVAAVLKAKHETSFRQRSAHLLRILMVVLVAGALLLCVLIDRLLINTLIDRLAGIGEGLDRIQRTGSLSERLAVNGHDEITALIHEINRLLDSVEASHQALERANAEMQQRVAERTAALADANAALEADIAERIKAEQEREHLREQLVRAQKMEAVGTLAGGIAHDFNNILTGILGHAQLLAGALKGGPQDETNLKQLVAAAERAAALVKKILAFSRQTPGERRLVPVRQVVNEVLSLLRAGLPSAIAMRCVSNTENDVVMADPTQLHQVLMNLGTNAGYAMGASGGELEVRISRDKVVQPLLGLSPGHYVKISVRDTGCGMSPEGMARIFDPFFSTKPVNEGTGLGLAVVHGIVLDHGGAIDVQSRVGQGTAFHIWLPAADSAADAPAQTPLPPLAGNERILLVDDEEIVRTVLEKGLQKLGYSVIAESSGQEALARVKATPDDFDLIITDQTMPQMSGLQLAAAIHAIRPNLPIILATGYSPDVAGRDPAALGLVGIVGKPMHFTELTQMIRDAVANKSS